MPRDKSESHIRILNAAKEEFLQHGFSGASMRTIAQRCDMTAAALYRHCRDKEDLFDQLVLPAIERMDAWLDDHVARYVDAVQGEEKARWQDSEVDMMRQIIYPNMEEYHLLIAKSKGTRHEHFIHDLTENSQKRLLSYFPMVRDQGYPVWPIGERELHLLLSAYTTALFEPVIHNYPVEEALRCLDTVEAFFLPGWKTLMGF